MDNTNLRKEEARHRREEIKRENERHKKFDRNLRIIAGVVTVLGAAATTLMKVMEIESMSRSRSLKAIKGKARTVKALKAPPKQKRVVAPAYMKLMTYGGGLGKLRKDANAALKMAKSLARRAR